MAPETHKYYDNYTDKSNDDWRTILDDERWKATWKDWQDGKEHKTQD